MHACTNVHELAYRLDAHVSSHWQAALVRHGLRLQRLFDERGRVVYDLYLRRLLTPPLLALRARQMQWYPRLPGGLADSRNLVAGSPVHQQRWSAVAVCAGDDTPLGMLVIEVQERLDRFELARRPLVFAFDSMGIGPVRAELYHRLSRNTDHPAQRRTREAEPA
jgi:Family of unknown function (DUF6022)